MIKKIILVASSIGLLLADSGAESKIYANGVKDTLNISESYFAKSSVYSNEAKREIIKGYLTYVVANQMNEAEIIRITSIGERSGFDVKFIKLNTDDVIAFGVNERKPDAIFIQQKLSSFNIPSKVVFVDTEVHHIELVAKHLINTIRRNIEHITKQNEERIRTLEGYIKKIAKNDEADYFPDVDADPILQSSKRTIGSKQKGQAIESTVVQSECKPTIKEVIVEKCTNAASVNQIIDVTNLQVVNRVVTKAYIDKHSKGDARNVEPLNKKMAQTMTIEKVDEQIKIVGKNIKEDVAKKATLPKLETLNAFYAFARERGAINKGKMLIIAGKAYVEGENIGKWKLEKVLYETGVIVVSERYLTGIKKQ